MEIQEEAIDVRLSRIEIEESLGRGEGFDGKTLGVQQDLEANQHAYVVIYDRHFSLLRHE
jgi:hypothetical protein